MNTQYQVRTSRRTFSPYHQLNHMSASLRDIQWDVRHKTSVETTTRYHFNFQIGTFRKRGIKTDEWFMMGQILATTNKPWSYPFDYLAGRDTLRVEVSPSVTDYTKVRVFTLSPDRTVYYLSDPFDFNWREYCDKVRSVGNGRKQMPPEVFLDWLRETIPAVNDVLDRPTLPAGVTFQTGSVLSS